MKLCRFVSGSSGFLRARSAICISNVDTSSMSLVHLMFPKCSSVFRYPPSLLIGSHGADSPTFKQYYEDTKTAFVLLSVFGFPRLRYRKEDRKSTRLNSSHVAISYAVFCLKKKKNNR